jgi:hypothetical protein
MDWNRTGLIDVDDIVDRYDATKHPDVLTGKKTQQEVLRQFFDTFEVGGEKDGKVTRQEWENYYTNISASIDDDAYFELMVRNAWHISGGCAWAVNSANRRVLATNTDGHESVEAIEDDLGLQNGEKAAMITRLRGQGVKAEAIGLFAGGEDGASLDVRATAKRPNPTYASTIRFG